MAYTTAAWRTFISNGGDNVKVDIGSKDDTIKVVVTHTAGTNSIHLYGISANVGTLKNLVINGVYGNLNANLPYTLLIGGKYDADTNGNKVPTFIGTVHDFTVYDEIMSDADISTYLGVSISA